MSEKKNIALIDGGYSQEEQVSLKSADNVYRHLDKDRFTVYRIRINREGWHGIVGNNRIPIDKNDFSFNLEGQKIKFDAVFIIIHGTPGEDGKLQAYFDMLEIPYTTSNALSSALSFNKYFCNKYLQAHGVVIAKSFLLFDVSEYNEQELIKEVGVPCFVKPNDGGSSFGTSKVTEVSELRNAVELAFQHGKEVIVEAYIQGREVTNGVYKDKRGVHALPITEIKTANTFFDYNAKYLGESEEITPAELSEQMTKEIQETSVRIFNYLNLKGIARVDYIITENQVFFLEVNTIPGQTSASLVPQQAAAAGISMPDMYNALLEACLSEFPRDTNS